MEVLSNNSIIEEEKIKNYTWDVDGKKIINSSRNYLTHEDKNILQYCFQSPLPDELREEYWLLITGAKLLKEQNPNYYNILLNKYPSNPFSEKNENQIYLDIYRTFPEDEEFKKEKIESLKNVLTAYSRRHSSLGYCQGFNYIVGKLLKVVKNEEDVFWIFTQIIENLLPINYYYDSIGIIIDNNILFEKMEILNQTLMKHFKKHKFELLIKNILYKWLICLFSQNIKDDLLFLIWDIFFIEGTPTLFRTIKIIFDKNEEQLLKITSVDKLINLFDSVHSLTLLNQHKEELLKDLMKYNKYINGNTVREGRRKNYRKVNESMAGLKIKKYNKMNNIKCDEGWDNCIKNQKKSEENDFAIFSIKDNIDVIEDFYINKSKRNNSFKLRNKFSLDKIMNEYYEYDKLRVQRRQHECYEIRIKRIKSENNIKINIPKDTLEGKYIFNQKYKIKKEESKINENNINEDSDEDNNDNYMNFLYDI